jgi:hypothetical protein
MKKNSALKINKTFVKFDQFLNNPLITELELMANITLLLVEK